MAHLLRHKFNLDPTLVRAVTGPFAEWVELDESAGVVTDADIAQAHKLLERLELRLGVDALKTEAAVRVAVLHRLWETHADRWPTSSNAPQYFGILIDTHMPLLMHPGELQLHEVYSRGLAPEQTSIREIHSDVYYPMTPEMVEFVWRPYINNAPVRCAPMPVRRKRDRGPNRKRKRAGAPGVELIPTVTEEPIPRFTVRQDVRTFVKTVTKSMPRSASIRSIRTLLCKSIKFKPAENMAIVHMVRLFILGAYRHCRRIAPPHIRVCVYRDTVESAAWMYATALEQLSSKALYAVIAEYVIGMAKTLPALFFILEKDPDWANYEAQAVSVCDEYLRPNFYDGATRAPPRIEVSMSRPLRSSNVFWAIAKHVGVRDRVPRRVLDAARGVCPNLSRLYTVFKAQCGRPRIFATALREVGVDERDIGVIGRAFTGLTAVNINKVFGEMVREVSPAALAVLHLYIHLLVHQSKFAVVPVRIQRDPVATKGHVPALLVCMSCLTIRSQAEGGSSARSKDGTHIDTINFGVTCSSCDSHDVRKVDLRHNRVVGLSINNMTEPRLYTSCRVCQCTTTYRNVVGCNELCEQCFENVRSRLAPKRCVCGTVYTSRNSVRRVFVARDDRGEYALFSLCDAHAHIMQHVVSADHPIQFYRNLIASA